MRYEGTRSFLTLLQDHEKSFAFVTKEYSIDRIRTASKHVRDLDLLEDNLGMLIQIDKGNSYLKYSNLIL